MATIAQIVNESVEAANLAKISTEKLIDGLKILKKTRTILIPVGLDCHFEKINHIHYTKTLLTLSTQSSELKIRPIDLKHHIATFKIL